MLGRDGTTEASTPIPVAAYYDPCMAHGFGYAASVRSWRGAPGAAPPLTANVETLAEVTSVDDFGRPLSIKNSADLHRSDDDLCTDITYATPTGTNERVLTAASSRTVSDCGTTVLASEHYEYDQLPLGNVAAGLATSHTVDRHSDTGQLLGTIRQFDAVYSNGNPVDVYTTREDGAMRDVSITFDPFGLVIVNLFTIATDVPTTHVTITPDPVTLAPTTTIDAYGTQYGASFDGFDRQTLSTVTPAGGAAGALSFTSFLGFSGNDSQGRRIVHKVFPDVVDPGTASTAPGRTTTVFLDELGRPYRSAAALGVDYPVQTMTRQRTYDGLGRIVFEADPFPSTQSFGTAYGTTSFFLADGTASCLVRGNGQQSPSIVHVDGTVDTNELQELYPTCFQRVFQDNTEVVSIRDAASLLASSPQFGVIRSGYATAIGQVIARSTWSGANRLEHATFSHDRLGRLTAMTRYQDAAGAAAAVTSSWHYDSLGQLLELDEPDSVPRSYAYSSWGELVDTSRIPPSGGAGLHVLAHYDALGRVIHREEQRNGVTDPETVHDYFYDQGVTIAPQVTPTHVLGRLAQATSPTGSVSFSYDDLGRINAQVFTDPFGGLYVEKRGFRGDGRPTSLDLYLPDTGFVDEHVTYDYDSAGRGKSVSYGAGAESQTLYTASQIDPFGRVREAQYGQATFTASYADVGRRLLNQVTVSSLAGSRSIALQSYDPVHRERGRTETKDGASTTTSHTYDALGRLSSSIKTTGTITLSNQQFAYDPLGNLLSQTDTAGGLGALHTTLSYLATDRDRICRIALRQRHRHRVQRHLRRGRQHHLDADAHRHPRVQLLRRRQRPQHHRRPRHRELPLRRLRPGRRARRHHRRPTLRPRQPPRQPLRRPPRLARRRRRPGPRPGPHHPRPRRLLRYPSRRRRPLGLRVRRAPRQPLLHRRKRRLRPGRRLPALRHADLLRRPARQPALQHPAMERRRRTRRLRRLPARRPDLRPRHRPLPQPRSAPHPSHRDHHQPLRLRQQRSDQRIRPDRP